MSLLKLKSEFCKHDAVHRLYNLDRAVIGLTGGIATGKSSAAAILKNKGLPLIDADALVKDIYGHSSSKDLILRAAPEALKGKEIDFKILRKLFFNDLEIKKRLETHIYSLLPQAFMARLSRMPDQNFVIYDVPLLFEKGLQERMDATLLIYAPKELQLKRLLARDNIDLKLAKKILSNQMPIEDKKELADFVIENTQDLGVLERNLDQFCRKILE